METMPKESVNAQQVQVKPKHPGGKPRRFTTPEEMQKAVDEYFEQDGPKTVSDLVLTLGFAHRQSLLDCQEYGSEYSDVVARAKARIQAYYELIGQGGRSGSFAGFVLTNMGWDAERNSRIDVDLQASKALPATVDEVNRQIEALEQHKKALEAATSQAKQLGPALCDT